MAAAVRSGDIRGMEVSSLRRPGTLAVHLSLSNLYFNTNHRVTSSHSKVSSDTFM
jgi:hypothetical protein